MRLFSIRTFELRLRPSWRSALFLIAMGIPLVFLSSESMRVGVAETLASNPDIGRLRRAEALDPANASLERLLGSVLCTLEQPNTPEGLGHLRRAIELSPNQAINWSALASACELSGDNECADQAFERALSIAPAVPGSEWAAANHYLATNRTDQALPHFERLLKLDPGYDWQTFRMCIRATGDPDLIFQKVVAPLDDTRLNLSYVNFLSSQGEMESARRAWTASMARATPFLFEAADPYLERLLQLGQGQEAESVWQDLEKLGAVKRPAPDSVNNAIFNGDFEEPPLNAGLDWRTRSIPYLFVDFADTAAQHGKRCLRVEFTVPRNDEFLAAYQLVPVAPASEYLLKAWVRTQNVSSDSGPRLRVLDTSCPSCLNALSDTTVGTTPWHQISLRFLTGPETQLVDLSVIRLRSRAFPTEITGAFWLDDVTLTPLGSAGQARVMRPAH